MIYTISDQAVPRPTIHYFQQIPTMLYIAKYLIIMHLWLHQRIPFSSLLPEDQTQHCMRAQTEQRGSPALIEAPQPLLAEYLHKTVPNILVVFALSVGICGLVIEACGYDVKWRHEGHHRAATAQAGHQGIEHTVGREHLHRQTQSTSGQHRQTQGISGKHRAHQHCTSM